MRFLPAGAVVGDHLPPGMPRTIVGAPEGCFEWIPIGDAAPVDDDPEITLEPG